MSYQAHYFLGVPIKEYVARTIYNWAEQNKDKLAFRNWVVPEDYHITLIFLGAATENQLNENFFSASTGNKPFISIVLSGQ